MTHQIARLLDAVDAALVPLAGGGRLDLYHIGRSALVWRFGSVEATADVDVLRPNGPAPLLDAAVRLFGRGTANARTHGLYLEAVDAALPPVPSGYRRRADEWSGPWQVIRLFHLDPHDLAATKPRRFAAKDREDIRLLCDLGLLDPDRLHAVLRLAWYSEKDEDDADPEQTRTFGNLGRVQAYLRGEAAAL